MHAFKNMVVFTLCEPWTMPAGELEEILSHHPLASCMPSQVQSAGWVSPRDDGQLVVSHERHLMIGLGRETRLLPGSVIKDAAAAKMIEFERQRGFKPGRKLAREIKEQVAAELLPKAFTKRTLTRAWIDPEAGRIIVDASSPARAEDVIEYLRDALTTLSAVPLASEDSPESVMTQWLQSGASPAPFALANGCLLSSMQDARAKVRFQNLPLEVDKLRKHIDEGMRASSIDLAFDGGADFTLNSDLSIKRLRMHDVEPADDSASDGPSEDEADMTLFIGNVRAILSGLTAALPPPGA